MKKSEIRKLALHLKMIEILERYSRIRRQTDILQRWKRLLIQPN